MGCHNVLVGQDSVLMGLAMYQSADGKEQLPPRLTSEGARVNPDWLLRFLKDPSQTTPAERSALAQAVSGHTQTAQNGGDDWSASLALHTQPGANRNGVRRYLKARMPTFNFSPNELQALVNFFMGGSSQAQPYIAERLDPLAPDEQGIARALFSSNAAPICARLRVQRGWRSNRRLRSGASAHGRSPPALATLARRASSAKDLSGSAAANRD